MDALIAATKTVVALDDLVRAERDAAGASAEHAVWMLQGIISGYVQHDKAHRWLGYAQGLLVSHGNLTLETAKRINKDS